MRQMRTLFFVQLCVLAVLGVLHVSALHFSLYWHYIWLDTVAHFLGGVWAVLVYVWVMMRLRTRRPRFLEVVCVALCIGIAWEVFEYSVGVPREGNWLLDSSVDLLMDVLGGLLGAFLTARITHNHA